MSRSLGAAAAWASINTRRLHRRGIFTKQVSRSCDYKQVLGGKTLEAIILAGQLAGEEGRAGAGRGAGEAGPDVHPPGQAPLTARLDTVINVLPALHTRGHDAPMPSWLRAAVTLRAGRGVAGRTLRAGRAAARTGPQTADMGSARGHGLHRQRRAASSGPTSPGPAG